MAIVTVAPARLVEAQPRGDVMASGPGVGEPNINAAHSPEATKERKAAKPVPPPELTDPTLYPAVALTGLGVLTMIGGVVSTFAVTDHQWRGVGGAAMAGGAALSFTGAMAWHHAATEDPRIAHPKRDRVAFGVVAAGLGAGVLTTGVSLALVNAYGERNVLPLGDGTQTLMVLGGAGLFGVGSAWWIREQLRASRIALRKEGCVGAAALKTCPRPGRAVEQAGLGLTVTGVMLLLAAPIIGTHIAIRVPSLSHYPQCEWAQHRQDCLGASRLDLSGFDDPRAAPHTASGRIGARRDRSVDSPVSEY